MKFVWHDSLKRLSHCLSDSNDVVDDERMDGLTREGRGDEVIHLM